MDAPPAPIRVLIADDHLIARQGVRACLELDPQIAVVGEAADGREAVRLAGMLAPDVILMDLAMPELDGVAAIVAIKAAWPEIEIVVLTVGFDEREIVRALKSGAIGGLLKDAGAPELIRAVRAAGQREAYLDPRVAQSMMAAMGDRPRLEGGAALTARERDVLGLMARGLGNKAIAEELGLSDNTVRIYVSAILAKLGLATRTQAAVYAVRAGLAPASPDRG
jgi:DNA-binding NarL/FixJ family response regulator